MKDTQLLLRGSPVISDVDLYYQNPDAFYEQYRTSAHPVLDMDGAMDNYILCSRMSSSQL